jgi:O-acetyl-ADP-ribose deacetylase (regulator of RNase III)
MHITHHGVTLELIQGNIAAQDDIEAVVNAANAQLQTGGGVAGAIHRAAGPELAAEARPIAPIKPGEAVITGGHDLPNDYVIHALGPVYGRDEPADELLRSCYQQALDLAEQHRVGSVAFPAISTGAFGYPVEAAAEGALSAVLEMMPRLASVEHIRFVLYDAPTLRVHEDALQRLTEAD